MIYACNAKCQVNLTEGPKSIILKKYIYTNI